MRRIVVILLFACIFAVATVASAKVCFLPHIFGGDESCLGGSGSGGNNPNFPPNPPQPEDPCEPDAVSQILGGWEGGLFNYIETSYNSGCYRLECSGIFGSSPQNTFNEDIFEVASVTYGNLTCYYIDDCKEPYVSAYGSSVEYVCPNGDVLETHDANGLKCVKCSDDSDPCPVNECSGYSLTEAPAHGQLAGSSCQVIYEENGECKYGPLKYNDYDCDEGYKPQNSTCEEKTCSDYGYQRYHCDSTEEETSHVVSLGSISGVCYECRKRCNENPCDGYDVNTKPANAHWTSEPCRYIYFSGTHCVDVGNWYKGWECDSGYTKSGESCVLNGEPDPEDPECKPEYCEDYKLIRIPVNATPTDTCQVVYADCMQGSKWYKDFECNEGYVRSGNSCVVSPEPDGPDEPECEPEYCEGYNMRTIPANATSTGSCQWVYASDCRKGDIWHLGFECNEGYVKVGNECRLKNTCTPEACSNARYTESTLPPNSHGINECQVINADCSNGPLKYGDFECNEGYVRAGNSCVQIPSCTPEPCTGHNYTTSNLPLNSYGINECQVINTDCSNGPLKYGDFACNEGYERSGNSCVQIPTVTCADFDAYDTKASCENTCVACSQQTFSGKTCWIPSGCKSGCVSEGDKVDFYSYTSYGNGCYKPDGCASGWQSTACSGTGVYSSTGRKSAHGSSILCTQCEKCTDSYHRYNTQADCRRTHWPEYCSSDSYGSNPSATCWDGSCSKAEFPYLPGVIQGALVDHRECCMGISGSEYCSDFLCDEMNGYIRSGSRCVCNTSGGWSTGANGGCYCEGEVQDIMCVRQSSEPTSCPPSVVGAYNAIGTAGALCESAIENFCNLYLQNTGACQPVYHIQPSKCLNISALALEMCEQEVEE